MDLDLNKIEKPKERLIAKLVYKYHLTLQQIAELKKRNVTGAVWKNDLSEDLIEYINSNLTRIKNTEFLFPGRGEGGSTTAHNLKTVLRNELKKIGLKLEDIGIKRMTQQPQERLKTIDEVLDFLNK